MLRAIMHRVIVSTLVPLLFLGCTTETRRPAANATTCQNGAWGCGNQQPPNGQYPYGANQSNYPTTQPGYNGYPPNTTTGGPTAPTYTQQPTYTQNPSTTAPTFSNTVLNPPPFSGYDPISGGDLQYLTNRTTGVIAELISYLDATTQARVRNIPIVYDSNAAEVNAYASCARSGKSAVTLTNGLELVVAHLAEAQAVDELYGTRRVDDYISLVAKNQRSGQIVVAPGAGFYTPAQLADPRKQSREQQVFEETIAFVAAHELAHHYLNHLPCTSVLPLDASEIGQVVTNAVPMFNQPNEAAADVAGITNVLRTGTQRNGYRYTETGALLTMRFFSGLDQSSPVDIFSFERSHPPPSVREPIIRTTAQTVRATAGFRLPWSG
jgi:hypothetical protein